MINNTDIIVIDEFSLLEQKPLFKMDEMLREMAVTKALQNKPFGGEHIILMGDPAQLPAIDKDIFETYLWRRFSIIVLSGIKRQNNKQFQTLLSEIRLGKVSDTTDKILQSRVLKNKDISSLNMDDAAIICSRRRERNKWNKKFLNTIDTEEHTFIAEDTNISGGEISEKDRSKIRVYHKKRLEDTSRTIAKL